MHHIQHFFWHKKKFHSCNALSLQDTKSQTGCNIFKQCILAPRSQTHASCKIIGYTGYIGFKSVGLNFDHMSFFNTCSKMEYKLFLLYAPIGMRLPQTLMIFLCSHLMHHRGAMPATPLAALLILPAFQEAFSATLNLAITFNTSLSGETANFYCVGYSTKSCRLKKKKKFSSST